MREAALVAALARERRPRPRRRSARTAPGVNAAPAVGAQRPLEDDRPLALVVARDAGELAGVEGVEAALPLPVNCAGARAGEVDEPEVDGVLRVAEDEVRLAGAGRQLRRESGSPPRRRTRTAGAGRPPASSPRRDPRRGWRPARRRLALSPPRSAAAAAAAPPARFLLLLRRHRQRRPVRARLLGAHVVPAHEEGDRRRRCRSACTRDARSPADGTRGRAP